MKILIDTSIILSDPTLLARKKEGISLLIPFPVRLEIANISFLREDKSSLIALLDAAVKEKRAEIYLLSTMLSVGFSERLAKIDIELITAAYEIKSKGDDVKIATRDKAIINAAASLGIPAIDLTQLREILTKESQLDERLASQAKHILASQTRTFITGIIIGIISNILAFSIWTYRNLVITKISVWATFILIILIGLLLYALRSRYRFPYGVFEFIFGLVLAVKVFWPEFDYTKLEPTDLFQTLAGVYVMVRGQDNIGHALKGSRFAIYWSKFSGER